MRGFYAYPASPPHIGQVIAAGIERLGKTHGLEIDTWEENDIAGYPLLTPILANIDQSDFLLADISRLNFNVTFEVGYAIAKAKRVFLTQNASLKQDTLIDSVGIFDTLGYEIYTNSDELSELVKQIGRIDPLPTSYPADRRAPVYIVETPRRDEMTLTLVSRIKKARLKFKSFNPAEDPRLSALDAIKKVAGSFGVAIPLLSSEMYGHEVHNIRGAFVAGLAMGFGLPTLLVQHLGGPVPLDVRDFVKSIRHPDELKDHVQEFAVEITERLQGFELEIESDERTLGSLSFGDPMAENEFETIDSYFLRTDQYLKSERGEVHLVVGRRAPARPLFLVTCAIGNARTK